MNRSDKMTLLCLPGLGGHRSVFRAYEHLLPEYDLKVIEIVDRHKAHAEARAFLAAQPEPVAIFCHCYSAQMGTALALELPDKVKSLVFLEPFFAQFSWVRILLPINYLLIGISKLLDLLHVRRRHITYVPDYVALAKYPDWVQPFFDLRWQDSTYYLDKYLDVLTYKLPPRVPTPTSMMFTPNGFTRSAHTKDKIRRVYVNARMTVMSSGTHNVLSASAETVAAFVRESIAMT